MTDPRPYIDPDADDLIVHRRTHYDITYECGCYKYFGDLDAPHDRPCNRHLVTDDEDPGARQPTDKDPTP